jgi:hypothetical protein
VSTLYETWASAVADAFPVEPEVRVPPMARV